MSGRTRFLMAGVMLGVGLLQAWDSHAFAAGGLVAVLAGAAVALPALAAIVWRSRRAFAAAVLGTGMLVILARLVSPVPLRDLGLLVLIAALTLFGPSLRREAVAPPQTPAPGA